MSGTISTSRVLSGHAAPAAPAQVAARRAAPSCLDSRTDKNGASMGRKKLVAHDQKCLEILVMIYLKWRKAEIVVEIISFHETSL